MEPVAHIWGVILIAIFQPGSAPLVDVNYQTMEECEVVRTQALAEHPDAQIWCTPTYKPESAPRPRHYRRRLARR